MEQLLDYLIKLSATLIVIYLFYWLVLRKLTFYMWNRWYLVGYSLAAFLMPLINIHPLLERTRLSDEGLVQWVPVLHTTAFDKVTTLRENNFVGNVSNLVIFFFVAGIFFLFVRLAIRVFSVQRVRKMSHLISDGEVRVYHVDEDVIPFSFGNSIFINRNKHSDDELRNIIRHEFIHVKQKHTIDILFSECLCILNWYNPFAWLLRNAIRQNLEFVADQKVLQNGIDRKKYQYLLLKVVGVQQFGIATNFNFTSLKKRIAMMNKLRSAKIHLVKFLFVLPLLTIILLAFRNKQEKQKPDAEMLSPVFVLAEEGLSDTPLVDTIPSSPKSPVKPEPPHVVRPNSKGFNITVADNNGECIVIIRNKQNKIVKALSLDEWNENEKTFETEYGEIPPTTPAPAKIPTPYPAPGAPVLPENVASIYIKNKKVTIGLKNGETEVYDLEIPEQMEAFTKKYNAVPASLKNPPSKISKPNPAPNEKNKPQPYQIIDSKEDNSNYYNQDDKLRDSGVRVKMNQQDVFVVETKGKVTLKGLEDFQGLVIVNDKEYDFNSFNNEVKLDAGSIKAVEVIKDDRARQLYGEKGKHGIIRIITK